ncbi:hypothetical protein GGH92_006453, partial [Coemansia sp. RSA 2673]
APQPRPVSIGVLTYNVRGIRGKKEELMSACHHAKASILCLQETLLHEGDWRLRLPGYDVLEEQAGGQGCRGVALACRRNLGMVQSGGIPGYMIVAAAHSISPGKKWSVGSLYIPHRGIGGIRREVLKQLKTYLLKEAWSSATNPMLLGGDFNMKPEKLAGLLHKWGTGCQVLTTSGSPKTWHGNNRAKQWTAIDHFIVNHAAAESLTAGRVARSVDLSDHWPLVTRIAAPGLHSQSSSIQPHQGWSLNRELLKDEDKQLAFASHNMWEAIRDLGDEEWTDLDTIADKIVESSQKVAQAVGLVQEAKSSHCKPFLDRATRHLIDEKRWAYKALVQCISAGRQEPEFSTLTTAYQEAKKAAQAAIRKSRDKQWSIYLQK